MKKYLILIITVFAVNANALNLPYDNIVQKYSGKYGLDPILVHAQIQQESTHVQNKGSPVGAWGLMQLMPGTASDLGVNRQDPEQNVAGGTRYMRQMLTMFNGNMVNALRAYNWGPGNMRMYIKGYKRTMPAETRDYTVKIRKYYIAYGGRGNHFNDSGVNTNNVAVMGKTGKLQSSETCKPVKLPQQANISFETIPPVIPSMVGGSGKVVFDPTKVGQYAIQIQEITKQIEQLQGQYSSVTKGLAGLNLLTNVSQLAGFELPQTLPSGFDNQQVFGQGGHGVYKSLSEQRASDTGVYANSEIRTSLQQNAQIANHAYVEAEMAWTQISCSVQTLAALNIETNTLKQSKDIQNRIMVENTLLQANSAKIRSSVVMMKGALMNYRTTAAQAMRKYGGK